MVQNPKCKDCGYWDEDNYKCDHPENPEPKATAAPDSGCDYGIPIE